MKKVISIISAAVMLSGCASNWDGYWDEEDANMYDVEAAPSMNVVNITSGEAPSNGDPESGLDQYYRSNVASGDNFGASSVHPQYANGQGVYNGRMLTKHVGDYVQNMTQDLISNMEYLSHKTPVGVTHFALIDSDLQKTNLLGYQLAESFVHELHKFRIPVIDYKATEYIRVTQEGDFFLSRDFLELSNKAPIEYILTGTMTKHQGGYLINARMLGLKSKAVVASAQMLVPFYVVDALLPSDQGMVDGVKLIQGE